MRLTRFRDAASFLDGAGEFLAADEARCHLPLGIARTLREDPGRYPGPNYLALLEDGGGVAGVAVMTPPHQLLFHAPAGAAEVLARDLSGGGWEPPGVHGPRGDADAFAAAWCLPRGLRARLERDMRSFVLDAVLPVPPAPGAMRTAAEADLDVAEEFHAAFVAEAHAVMSLAPREAAARSIRGGRLFLWEDGARVVAQAAVAGDTPTGVRIGIVYTPPGERRRGYATALVAALSARMLASGRKRCFLFTDLANPVSNSIYPRVGYRPVADFREWAW